MSDKKIPTPDAVEEPRGVSRRTFLGTGAVTGAVLAGATALGAGTFTRESWAAAAKEASRRSTSAPASSTNTTVSGAAATKAR